jgi:molybdate transport system substrate-binding protein
MTVLLLAPVAVKAVVPVIAAAFREATGQTVEAEIVLNPEVPRRITQGAAFDVAITNPWYVPDLVASGYADGSSVCAFGRVPLALAVAGAHGECVSDPGAIAALLLAAGSIAYTGPGTSGRIFREMADRLGVLDRIEGLLNPMDAGQPIRAVAGGACALAAAPLTVVRATPGVRAAAICPAEMGTDIEMSVFLGTGRSEGAERLLSVLTDPAMDPALAEAGVMRMTGRP